MASLSYGGLNMNEEYEHERNRKCVTDVLAKLDGLSPEQVSSLADDLSKIITFRPKEPSSESKAAANYYSTFQTCRHRGVDLVGHHIIAFGNDGFSSSEDRRSRNTAYRLIATLGLNAA